MFPLSFAIIRDEFPPERVGVGIGLVSGAGAAVVGAFLACLVPEPRRVPVQA